MDGFLREGVPGVCGRHLAESYSVATNRPVVDTRVLGGESAEDRRVAVSVSLS
jgi:hypothetical protein